MRSLKSLSHTLTDFLQIITGATELGEFDVALRSCGRINAIVDEMKEAIMEQRKAALTVELDKDPGLEASRLH